MRINGFEQIKGFYSWIFDNQEKNIKPQHISLYMFMLNQNNRNNWVEWFKMPFDLAMTGACISSKKTYYACLNDLRIWGLIEYEKGVNNWKAPLIKVEVLKDTSTVPQSEPQQHHNDYHNSTTTDAATVPQPIPNIKPITYNNKLITSNEEMQVEVLKFFGFDETPQNINHQRRLKTFFFLKTKSGEINHFMDQFVSYSRYIVKSGKISFKFRMENFLGNNIDFEDGKWNSENWKQKLSEATPVAPIILGYSPQLPGN